MSSNVSRSRSVTTVVTSRVEDVMVGAPSTADRAAVASTSRRRAQVIAGRGDGVHCDDGAVRAGATDGERERGAGFGCGVVADDDHRKVLLGGCGRL
jgi:hypothetical protein